MSPEIMPTSQKYCCTQMDWFRTGVQFIRAFVFRLWCIPFSRVIPCANRLISASARPPRAWPARDALTVCDETRNPWCSQWHSRPAISGPLAPQAL